MAQGAVIWGVLAFSLARLAIDGAALWPLAERALAGQKLTPLLIGAPLLIGPLLTLAALAAAPRLVVRTVRAR